MENTLHAYTTHLAQHVLQLLEEVMLPVWRLCVVSQHSMVSRCVVMASWTQHGPTSVT